MCHIGALTIDPAAISCKQTLELKVWTLNLNPPYIEYSPLKF